MTCLPNSKDVQNVVDLATQNSKNLEKIRYWIDTTSGSPKLSQQIASQLQEYQVDYLDCAVSGGPDSLALTFLLNCYSKEYNKNIERIILI